MSRTQASSRRSRPIGSAPVIPTLNLTIRVQNKTTVDAYVDVTNTATSTSYGEKKFRKNKTDSQTWTASAAGQLSADRHAERQHSARQDAGHLPDLAAPAAH